MGSVETVETFWQLRLSTWPLCGLSGRLQVMLIHTLFSKAYRILHACPKFKLRAVHVNTIAIGGQHAETLRRYMSLSEGHAVRILQSPPAMV